MNLKQKMQDKRDIKYSTVSTWQFSAVTPYFNLLLRAHTFFPAWHFIFSVIKNFFIIQQKQVYKITKTPVIKVDTDLDFKIPFEPEKVDTYLSFVPFFVKPLAMLIKRFGYLRASKYINGFLRHITTAYKQAASIYRVYFSTTERPEYKENASFRAIHAADPHLLCVPSLHVAICALTYSYYKKLFAQNIFSKNEAEFRLKEIKDQALAIIESVLFVKQHSVNCIPTALYMVTVIFEKDFFTSHDAVEFIESLFKESPEINEQAKKELTDYFIYMYERTFLENYFDDKWQDPILLWLKNYAIQTGQYTKEQLFN